MPFKSFAKVYIGQTGCTLQHCLKVHRRALVSGEISLSAVAQHAVDKQHDIDWEGATVVDGHPQFHQRCTLEAWHICSNASTINRDAGPLPSVYNPLIHCPQSANWRIIYDMFPSLSPPTLTVPIPQVY